MGGMAQPIGYEIMWILNQLFLSYRIDPVINSAGTDHVQKNATDDLDKRMRTFQDDADFKDLVYAPFIHLAELLIGGLICDWLF